MSQWLSVMHGTRSFNYDADSNLTSFVENSSETVYIWNAENRLITVQPAAPAGGDKKLEFICDYMDRRVKKSVYTWSSGNWTLSAYSSKNETYAFMHDRPQIRDLKRNIADKKEGRYTAT